MPIQYHIQSQEFHLYNDQVSYLIRVLENGQLGHLYYGARIPDEADHGYLVENTYRPMTTYVSPDDYSFSLSNVQQEYPPYGTSDYRHPAYEVKQANGSTVTNFTFEGYQIINGKPQLTGLPATYASSSHPATTLEIALVDQLTQVKMILSYSIFSDSPIIARNVRFENHGKETVTLTTAQSLSVDLPDADYEWVQFSGAWGRERHPHVTPLRPGLQAVDSLRGASSHMQNPFLILKRPQTTEMSGEAYAVSLVYSGNFLAQAEVNEYDVTRLQIGINPFHFAWQLTPGTNFQTPEALIAYTEKGLNDLSQSFHRLYNDCLVRGAWQHQVRPVLINNWEATYFDFTEEKLIAIAKQAKKLGIELFVLDDGWFGERMTETDGLGDWWPNPKRLPNGIAGLANQIHQLGLKFGLWFEPEMANRNSKLVRQHPDWLIQTPNRPQSQGRRQYVLDLAQPEVIDYLFDLIAKVLHDGQIDYVKWDMNRNMSEVYSLAYPANQQGEIFHRYILGVYQLYERLRQAFPKILFESCASGGGRFDAGMLYYAPQAWTSDDSDAIERLAIQGGTSYGYPLSSMGAHVSVTPNEQVGRLTPLNTRGNVAYFGDLGYELDITQMTPAELAQIKAQIEEYKRYRSVFQYGNFYRLTGLGQAKLINWLVVSQDQRIAILGNFKVLNDVNAPYRRLRIPGLKADFRYHVTEVKPAGKVNRGSFTGQELARLGLVISDASAGQTNETTDFYSRCFILEAE
ncbi:MAG TPA: alpha-galactosidase [Candidatus Limosilactobacillus faecipullorum]|nr:alpha-galactosidase [Candidatus Limosilactobacillus faecipullorum]